VASTQKRSILSGLDIGVPLFSITAAIIAAAVGLAATVVFDTGPRIVLFALAAVLVAILWTAASRNNRVERDVRRRLQAEHPGALVERVRLWSLPHGRVEPGTPLHFVIADASEISFEDVDQVVLLRVPVAELGLIDVLTASGDRARDKAVTLIYGDDQLVVQFFTITYTANNRLEKRVRTAIGWPAEGTP
jgi:hypothetical protein